MLMRLDPLREMHRAAQPLRGRVPLARPMDAYRERDRFVVKLDLPGVDPESIDLAVDADVLTVKVERSWPRQKGGDVLASERPKGSLTRQLLLAGALDTGGIEARYDQGVLTLTVPVRQEAKVRRVEVRSGKAKSHAIEADTVA